MHHGTYKRIISCVKIKEIFGAGCNSPPAVFRLSFLLAEELEGEEDGEIVLLDDGEIDVGDLAYTAFVLDMDTKHLCSEDCKGLCPGCGVNLNQEPCRCKKQADPRWAALEQLLNKN